jgi:hypothetical protein
MPPEHRGGAVVQRLVLAARRLEQHHPKRFDRMARVAELLETVRGPRKVMVQNFVQQPKLRVVVPV